MHIFTYLLIYTNILLDCIPRIFIAQCTYIIVYQLRVSKCFQSFQTAFLLRKHQVNKIHMSRKKFLVFQCGAPSKVEPPKTINPSPDCRPHGTDLGKRMKALSFPAMLQENRSGSKRGSFFLKPIGGYGCVQH